MSPSVSVSSSIYNEGPRTKFLGQIFDKFNRVILGANRKFPHSCLLSRKLKKELLFDYSPW